MRRYVCVWKFVNNLIKSDVRKNGNLFTPLQFFQKCSWLQKSLKFRQGALFNLLFNLRKKHLGVRKKAHSVFSGPLFFSSKRQNFISFHKICFRNDLEQKRFRVVQFEIRLLSLYIVLFGQNFSLVNFLGSRMRRKKSRQTPLIQNYR